MKKALRIAGELLVLALIYACALIALDILRTVAEINGLGQ